MQCVSSLFCYGEEGAAFTALNCSCTFNSGCSLFFPLKPECLSEVSEPSLLMLLWLGTQPAALSSLFPNSLLPSEYLRAPLLASRSAFLPGNSHTVRGSPPPGWRLKRGFLSLYTAALGPLPSLHGPALSGPVFGHCLLFPVYQA